MIIYTHKECLLKNNGPNHPERKERLDSILESIKKAKDIKINLKESPLAQLDTVTLVHPRKYIEKIFSNIPQSGIIGVEKEPFADTMLCPNSKNAILSIKELLRRYLATWFLKDVYRIFKEFPT